jgi:hypothetical protein
MKEDTVRRFFEGEYGPAHLEADFPGTVTREGPVQGPSVYRFHVEPMSIDFALEPSHIVKLIDAVLAEQLRPEILQITCEWLDTGSDSFLWDADTPEGARVAETLFWIGTPEINYPLTQAVLSKIRHYLLTGENLLTPADADAPEAGA